MSPPVRGGPRHIPREKPPVAGRLHARTVAEGPLHLDGEDAHLEPLGILELGARRAWWQCRRGQRRHSDTDLMRARLPRLGRGELHRLAVLPAKLLLDERRAVDLDLEEAD